MMLDTLIFLLWGLFFLAAVLGIANEYRQNHAHVSQHDKLEDDDPVYLVDTFVKETIR
ncbi:MAG: hypothetical protein AAFR59_12300 [Bacteroidota bacterium]